MKIKSIYFIIIILMFVGSFGVMSGKDALPPNTFNVTLVHQGQTFDKLFTKAIVFLYDNNGNLIASDDTKDGSGVFYDLPSAEYTIHIDI